MLGVLPLQTQRLPHVEDATLRWQASADASRHGIFLGFQNLALLLLAYNLQVLPALHYSIAAGKQGLAAGNLLLLIHGRPGAPVMTNSKDRPTTKTSFEFLQARLRLSRTELDKVMQELPSLPGDNAEASALTLLEDLADRLELNETDLKAIVLSHPPVLGLNMEANVVPVLSALQEELGLSKAGLKETVLAYPHMLSLAIKAAPKFCPRFTPRSRAQQLEAIGLNSHAHGISLPKHLHRLFDPSGGDWEDIDVPQPYEWLDVMFEKTPDQSFEDFVSSVPNIPNESKNVIYLQPLCDPSALLEPPFPAGNWPAWSVLESAVQQFFFPLEVQTLPAISMGTLKPVPCHRAERGFGTQWHAGQILDSLQGSLPADAYCMLAVTMFDLYRKSDWNFVYGLARKTKRVGVFSFVRHAAGSENSTSQSCVASVLHSSIKTLLHEIGHMFGMKHCTWFNCLMRGSNGKEIEHQPNYLHLCPVCLRKLHWSIGLDVPSQHSRMLHLFQPYEGANQAFKKDCDFLRARLSKLQDFQTPNMNITSN